MSTLALPTSAASPGPVVTLDAGAPPGPALDTEALHDLALDQVVQRLSVTIDPALAAWLTLPLTSAGLVRRRQDVFRALDEPGVRTHVDALLTALATCEASYAAAAKAWVPAEADLWRLHAAVVQVDALVEFAERIVPALDAAPRSDALLEVAQACAARVASAPFEALRSRVHELAAAVRGVRVAVWVRGATVTVARFDDEPDDAAAIAATFARFAAGGGALPRVEVPRTRGMDEVQGRILTMTAELHPEVFDDVHRFAAELGDLTDPVIARFAHDVRFHLAYLDLLAPLRRAGLPVCYPRVDTAGVGAEETFDLALALTLISGGQRVVTNDVELAAGERLLVVTGPNQGGKTTLARTLGQLHHLAAVGCPVPGRRVEVALTDRVLTHFERPEHLDNLAGRLGEALTRMRNLLETATSRSVLVLNEVFTSTSVDDARFLTREVLARTRAIGALTVCVTFIDDLARFDDTTVSMVADVDPADPAVRTYRLSRRPADGRAYAQALAERHGLTPRRIRDRIEGWGL